MRAERIFNEKNGQAGFTLLGCVMTLVIAAVAMLVAVFALVTAPRAVAEGLSAEEEFLAVDACMNRLEAAHRANLGTGAAAAAVLSASRSAEVCPNVVVTVRPAAVNLATGAIVADRADDTVSHSKMILVTMRSGRTEARRAWSN